MRRVLLADQLATAVLWSIAGSVILILIAIIAHFLLAALPDFSLSFLTADPSTDVIGGVGPVLWNSVYVLTLTMLVTAPLGVLGAVFMAEYAGTGRLTNLIRFSQELIGSVPSIVVGLFGFAVFVASTGWGFTALAGALALSVFNLPLMTRLAEQAMRAVPDDERSASFALGATKWQTVRHVVLPIAIPGLVTGVILTAGRVFGEAAALLFTAGLATPGRFNFANLNLLDPRSPWSPFHTATTLSVYLWRINSEGTGPVVGQVANLTAAVLIAAVLIFNLGSRALGRLLQRRITGTRS
jgi:phosphate transport system permease protein